MRIRKRLIAIALAGGIGGLLFIPLLRASRPGIPRWELWLLPLGSFVVTALCAWGGLKIADQANLPMPFLRPWEKGEPGASSERAWMLRVSVAAGGIFGLAAEAAYHWRGITPFSGSLLERLAALPFAVVVPETVAHLLVMSALVLLTKRTWIAILLSSLLYVLPFHGQWTTGASVTGLFWAVNFLLSVLTGWVYSRYGIESAYLTHGVAQAILLGLN
jgi:hypothetical protein